MSRISRSQAARGVAERRAAKRYDLALSVRYARLDGADDSAVGLGETVNISRTGLLFRSEGNAHEGDHISALIDWPVLDRHGEPLKLMIAGVVVRVGRPFVAVSLFSHHVVSASKVGERLDAFPSATPVKRAAQARPAQWTRPPDTPRSLVLVDEEDSVAELITMALANHNCLVERAEPARAKDILEQGYPPVVFVVTRTPELLDILPDRIPAILLLAENAPEQALGKIRNTPGRIAIRKPLTVVALRVLMRFYNVSRHSASQPCRALASRV